MPGTTIVGEPLPGMPWQDRPSGCRDVTWRYDANSVVPRDAVPGAEVVDDIKAHPSRPLQG